MINGNRSWAARSALLLILSTLLGVTLALRHPHRVSRLGLVSAAAFDQWPTRDVKLARAMLPLTRLLPSTWLVSVLRADLLWGYANADLGTHSVERYVRPFAEPDGRDAPGWLRRGCLPLE